MSRRCFGISNIPWAGTGTATATPGTGGGPFNVALNTPGLGRATVTDTGSGNSFVLDYRLRDADGDTYITQTEGATDSLDFFVDGINVMSLSAGKLTLNGIFIDPATGLELQPQGAVSALANDADNVLWINSANGRLHRGSRNLENHVSADAGNVIKSDASGRSYLSQADVLSLVPITGKFIGSSATFAGLPIVDVNTNAAENGDWAALTADDGGNASGIYVYDGVNYSFVAPLSTLNFQPRVFAPNTTINPAIPGSPSLLEIQTFSNNAGLSERIIYYTGTDGSGDTVTRTYHADVNGAVTPIGKPQAVELSIYDGSGSLSGLTTVTMGANTLIFQGAAGSAFTVLGQTVVGFITAGGASFSINDGGIAIGLGINQDLVINGQTGVAGQAIMSEGPDASPGWGFVSNEIVFIPSDQINPAVAEAPSAAEVKIWNDALASPHSDTVLYWNNTLVAATDPTYVYYVDRSRTVILIYAQVLETISEDAQVKLIDMQEASNGLFEAFSTGETWAQVKANYDWLRFDINISDNGRSLVVPQSVYIDPSRLETYRQNAGWLIVSSNGVTINTGPLLDTDLGLTYLQTSGDAPNTSGRMSFIVTGIKKQKVVIDPASVEVDDQMAIGYIDIGTFRFQTGKYAGGAQSVDIILPAPFKDDQYSAGATVHSTGANVFSANIHSLTDTQFTVRKRRENGAVNGDASNEAFDWWAFGLKP